nr:TonB-dependent receptor [Luteibacter sp. Sphag1AF]
MAIAVAIHSAAHAQTQAASAGASENMHVINVPAQPLSQAVLAYARQAGIDVYVDDAALAGRQSQAMEGNYTALGGLEALLAGSGVGYRQRVSNNGARVNVQLYNLPAAGTVVTDSLPVGAGDAAPGGDSRDMRGANDVFDNDFSSVYKGKAELEHYRGTQPADALKGMVNVFSGDMRNGGALDPNVRGIEGPGRVPVIIDGTEQALTVWRGYNGANNRSYIDPSLIGGIQVLKGPGITRDVNSSVGGAVVVKTLSVDDIVKPGKNFGIEVKAEGANNSTSPRLPTLLTGQDYRNVPGFPGNTGSAAWSSPNAPYTDPTLREKLKTDRDNKTLSMGDRAWRAAIAGKTGDFDLLGAYAYRNRGNYYSGRNDAQYYEQEGLPQNTQTLIRRLANDYRPGDEIPNTSSKMQSWLFKTTWHITDDQSLELGLRDSLSHYGEIMPSRIFVSGVNDIGAIQWPESKVDAKAYNLKYRWNPDNSPYINLHANVWTTRTASHTYTSGGFPNYAQGPDNPIIYNTALANSQNNRVGFTVSNKMHFGENVDLTIGGDMQHEKLSSSDVYNGVVDGWRQYPRAGRRDEYNINFAAQWRPLSFLTLDAGMRYSAYRAHDDFLASQVRAGKGSQFGVVAQSSREFSYDTMETSPEAFIKAYRPSLVEAGSTPEDIAAWEDIVRQIYEGQTYQLTNTVPWLPDSKGKYSRGADPCVNGTVKNLPNYVADTCMVTTGGKYDLVTGSPRTRRGHAWAPMLSATFNFTRNSRAYIRYAEAYRFPSMFESTIGFSASINPLNELRPEHARTWEVAYIHDLRDVFSLTDDHRADVKLTYFRNKTTDVIERGNNLQFTNLDKQVIQGLEFQARYDNGRFFTDIGVAKTLKNKACDESVAILLDPNFGRVPSCVNYGFIGSYLLTQASPKLSVNWTLGARFFNEALEIGARGVYYRAYDNPQLTQFVEKDKISGYGLNVPYTWGTIVTYDAYADYKLKNGLTFELAGTNLSNRYYVDPLTRSLMPAPGRTLRMSVTASF